MLGKMNYYSVGAEGQRRNSCSSTAEAVKALLSDDFK